MTACCGVPRRQLQAVKQTWTERLKPTAGITSEDAEIVVYLESFDNTLKVLASCTSREVLY